MDIDLFCEIARFLHEKKYNEFIVYELNKIFIKMVYYKINTKTPYNNYSDHKINVKQIIGEDFKSNYPNISENTIKRDINKALEEIKYVFNNNKTKLSILDSGESVKMGFNDDGDNGNEEDFTGGALGASGSNPHTLH